MKEYLKNSVHQFVVFYKSNKFVVWFFLFLWLTLSLATANKDVLYFSANEEYTADTWVLYLRGFLLWSLAALFTPLIFKLAHLFPVDEREHRRKNLFYHLIFSICFLFIVAFTFAPIFYFILQPDDPFKNHLLWTMYWYNLGMPVAYWFIIGGLLLRKNIRLYNERLQRALTLQTELKKIQLKVLQVQLRPHFLFNALNTVSALIYEDEKAAIQILKKIRTYLGLSTKETDKTEITLQEELDFTNLYLEIEKERYSDRLHVEQKIDTDADEAMVPTMILQPLVENAIRHGISKKTNPGKIIVHAARENNHLLLQVEDSGLGFDAVSTTKKEGLGIKNTIERLNKLYQSNYQFDINDSDLGGAKISILIPYNSSEENFNISNPSKI